MKDYGPKLAPRIAEDLQPGEEIRAAVRTQSVADATRAGGVGGVAGSVGGVAAVGILAVFALREAHNASRRPAPELTPETMKLAALGLTDRRLAVWARSKMTGRPGELLGAISLDELRSVIGERGRLAHVLRLGLTSGDELTLEVFRGDDVEHFARAFSALRSA